jgi:Bacterial TSP3 repeat/IPT/TIG domain
VPTRSPITRSLLTSALIAAAFPAAATASTQTSPPPTPVIKTIKPMSLQLGETLTITGRNFIKGKNKTTVVFKRDGHRTVFVRAIGATSTKLTVVVPDKLLPFFTQSNGIPAPTRFRVNVLARRFGERFTALSASPLVSPRVDQAKVAAPAPTATTATTAPAAIFCDPSDPNGDADGDGLSNGLEQQIGTDPCKADTDGDGVPDGFEYQSALDLNRTAGTSAIPVPYPGKRPYPNPLDPSDANTDYDGDGLTLMNEYRASKYLGWTNDLSQLPYSDGKQLTGTPIHCNSSPELTAYCAYADINHDGILQDDEKDADGDGLPNWDELYGRETQLWWTAVHGDEPPYPLTYQTLDWLNPDSDGDGIVDGQDDSDHDGYTNIQEISRPYATSIFTSTLGAYDPANGSNDGPFVPLGDVAEVNPFNPCLPDPNSPACMRHPPLANPPAPFSGNPVDRGPNGSQQGYQLAWPHQWGSVGP